MSKILLSFIFLVSLASCKQQQSDENLIVNLSSWANYVDPQLITEFETQTGIKVNISNYSSNEELLAKIQAGASGIDVAIPSDYMVAIMKKLELLNEVDVKKIPNIQLISPEYLHQNFDQDNKYSLPYCWSTVGIAVNRELFKGSIKSWKDVFLNTELSGKISLLDDVREVTAAALKMHGYSVNSTKPAELKMAESTILDVKPRVKMFRSDTIDALINKEVAVAQSYSTDALQAVRNSGGTIEYILPEDGGTKAIDNLVIVKGSKNIEAAHQLINFLLSLKANVSFVKSVMGGPVLRDSKSQLPEELQKNQSLFPTSQIISRYENIIDLGDATALFDALWTKIKTE